MEDFSQFEARLSDALNRINKGVATLADKSSQQTGAASAELEALTANLAKERATNEELEARLAELKARQETQMVELQDATAAQNNEMRRLRGVIRNLRHHNAELRQANAGDASLINTSMQTELDAVNAVRDSALMEVDGVLGELTKLVQVQGE